LLLDSPAAHGGMTAESNVDLEPESEDEEVVPVKEPEAAEEPATEPPILNGEPTDLQMPIDGLGGEAADGLRDPVLDMSGNGNLRAELTSADAPMEADGAPAPLLVEADAPGIAQEPMEIEYDDEVLQIGDLTDPWILPDYADQDARMEKAFGIHDGEGEREEVSNEVKTDHVRGFRRSGIYAMDWAGDKLLIAAKESPGIRLQDVEKGEEERTWQGEWMSIRTDPTNPCVAAAVSWNGKFKIFDTRSSSQSVFDVDLKKTATSMRDFLCLCWSPDSRNIALSNRNDQIYLLSLRTPKGDSALKLGSSRNMNVEVNQMAYSPGGANLWVTTGGNPGKIQIFPSHTLQNCDDAVIAHNWTAISLACDPTGQYMCTGGADGLITVWEPRQPLCLRCFLHPGQVITNVDFNYNGSLIAWGTGAGERSLTLMGANTAIPYYQELTPATVTQLRWHSAKNVLAYSLNPSQMSEDRPHRDRRGGYKDTPVIQLLKLPDDL